jgi:Protein of unknown function (DUF2934)
MEHPSKGGNKAGNKRSVIGQVSRELADSVSTGGEANDIGAHGSLQSSDREKRISIIAYYKAEQRGFQEGHELDDWLAAEREFDGAYLVRTVGQYGEEP